MPFRKFPYLKNAPNRERQDCLENYLQEHHYPFIVRDEFDSNSHRLYPSKEHYLHDVKPHITEHLHEAIYAYRKIFIDLDGPQDQIDELGVTRQQICDEIISGIISTFLLHYDISLDIKDLIISDSSDETKLSQHFVVDGYFVTSGEEHECFMQKLLSTISEVDYVNKREILVSKPFIDRNKTAETTYLRMPNCTKVGSNRVKRIISGHSAEEMFISQTAGCRQLPAKVALKPKDMKVNHNITDGDAIREKIQPYTGDGALVFRDIYNGMLCYNRVRPSFCEICKRTHDSENSLYATVTEYDIYIHCRRSPHWVLPGQPRTIRIPLKERPVVNKCVVPDTFEVERYCEPKVREYNFEDSPCLLIRANMGTGKTEALESYIAKLDDSWDIIMITMRKSFTLELLRRFKDFHVYYNSKGPLEQKRLICQYESCHRISLKDRNKVLLVLDESESVIEQIEHDNANRSGCWTKFEYLVKNSTNVIMMDALMGDRTYYLAEQSGKKVKLSINKFTRVNEKVDYYYDEQTFNKQFSDAVMFAKDKHIVVVTTSKLQGEAMMKVANQRNPGLRVGFYSSETDNKSDIENVNEIWSQYDLLIYTPTVSAGVSFTREHFSHMFCYFDSRSCPWQTAFQMTGRIRSLERNRHICVKKYATSLPTTIAEVEEAMITTLSNSVNTQEANIENIKLLDAGCVPPVMLCPNGIEYRYEYKNTYYWVKAQNILNKCQSVMHFEAYFRHACKKAGYQSITRDKDSNDVVNFRMLQAKREVRAERIGAVANADLTDLDSIRAKDRESMTKAERDVCDKADILVTYKLTDEKLLTPEFVKKFGKQQTKDAFYNANALCVTGSHNLIQSAKIMMGIKAKPTTGDSMKDLDADPMPIKRSIALCLLSNLVTSEVGTCGLEGKCLGDSFGLDRADIDARYARFVTACEDQSSFIKLNFELDINSNFADQTSANKTKIINKILYTLGMKINIKKTGRGNNNIAVIRLAPEFKFDITDNMIKIRTN